MSKNRPFQVFEWVREEWGLWIDSSIYTDNTTGYSNLDDYTLIVPVRTGNSERLIQLRDLLNDLWEKHISKQWISVEDRLPDASGRYLVAYGHCSDFDVLKFRDGEFWHRSLRGCRALNVTHWMSAPEPPEMEQHSGKAKAMTEIEVEVWVSAEKELPNWYVPVLCMRDLCGVYNPYGRYALVSRTPIHGTKSGFPWDDVTHWQHLPEPPVKTEQCDYNHALCKIRYNYCPGCGEKL